MRRFVCLLGLLLLLGLAGCGSPRSRVHGTIRCKGQPLARATIIFLAPDNQAYPARIRADGSYQVASLPRGRILVGIQVEGPRVPPRLPPQADGRDELAAAKAREDDANKQRHRKPAGVEAPLEFPARYADPSQSNLVLELTEADQEYSLDLK